MFVLLICSTERLHMKKNDTMAHDGYKTRGPLAYTSRAGKIRRLWGKLASWAELMACHPLSSCPAAVTWAAFATAAACPHNATMTRSIVEKTSRGQSGNSVQSKVSPP